MTVRQTFYQLVVRNIIEKTEKEYQGTVIRLLAEMRLSGELPLGWIIDESRRRRITQTYDTLAEAVDACADFYRRSALREASDDIEITGARARGPDQRRFSTLTCRPVQPSEKATAMPIVSKVKT
jgi:hypothetical protein